jgi:hypothetical protein
MGRPSRLLEREREREKTSSARASQTEGYKVPGILSLRHPPLANNSSGSPNEPRALQEVGPSYRFISYCYLHRLLVSCWLLAGRTAAPVIFEPEGGVLSVGL